MELCKTVARLSAEVKPQSLLTVRPGICGAVDRARERRGIDLHGCVRVPDSNRLLDLAVTVYDSTGLKRSLSSQVVSGTMRSVRARLLGVIVRC